MIYWNLPIKLSDKTQEAFCKIISWNHRVWVVNYKWWCIYENEKNILLKVYADTFESLCRKVNERISEDFFPYDAEYYIEKIK